MTEIKDFSKVRKRIRFQIDEDVFEAAPAVPADILIDYTQEFAGVDPEKIPVDQQLKVFRSVLELTLLPESLERFTARMRNRENPIEIDQIGDVITWLFEEYGLRPTELPSDSSGGQLNPASGTSSTVSTQGPVSISAASPSTVS
jgi:hypothetical protein